MSSKGSREFDAVKQRLAAAKAQMSSASEMENSAQQMLETAQKNKAAAQNELKAAEESWKEMEVDHARDLLLCSGHAPVPVDATERNHCVVCKLEEPWRREDGLKDHHGKSSRSQKHMAVCSDSQCQLGAHVMPMNHKRKIFDIEQLKGLSCFEIAHSELCKGIWRVSAMAGEMKERKAPKGEKTEGGNNVESRQVKARSYELKRTHPVYRSLAQAYGRTPEKRRRATPNTAEDCKEDAKEQKKE